MRKFLILAAGVAAFTSFAPASYAQGIVSTPRSAACGSASRATVTARTGGA